MAKTETESLPGGTETAAGGDSIAGSGYGYAIPILILLHVAVTLFLAYKLNIWVDEAFSLHTTERGVGYAFQQALHFELQAPLYFILLSIWRKLDSTIFFARLLSVASVAVSLRVIAAVSKRLWSEVHPGWIVAVVAFNPVTIGVAVDVRLYALVFLLSALLLLTFYDGYLAQSTSRRARICHVLVAVIALYTQYYTGFLLAGSLCALLVLKRWRPLRQYLLGMAVVALCFTPMLPFIRYQLTAHTAPIYNRESWFEVFKFVTWRMKDYLLPLAWDVTLEIRSWLLRILYITTIYIVYKKRRDIPSEIVAVWTIALVVASCFLITARFSGELLLQIRHTIVLFFPVNLAALSIFILPNKKKLVLVWAIIVLAFTVASLGRHYRPLAKSGDWRRVAEYLMTKETPEQTILVFHAGAALPLSRYYAGKNVLVPVPRENTFERFDFHDYVLRDEREIIVALDRTPGTHERVWLVTDEDCGYADLKYNCDVLETYVGKYYTVEETRNFLNSTVRLLRRK